MKRELSEELRALITEAIFNHRWVLLEGYHALGEEVIRNNLSIEEVAAWTGQRPKTIHYCVELVKAHPNLSSLPEGKNMSWYKVTKTLPPYEKNSPKKKDSSPQARKDED